MKIAVSFLKSPDSKEKTIEKISSSTADYIHVDLMDGKLYGEKNFDKEEMYQLLEQQNKPLDIHLMTEDIEEYIDYFSKLKPSFITFHIEANCNPLKMLHHIKQKQIKAGLAISPDTKLEKIIPYLNEVDLILVMSVIPGKGGQSFLPCTKNRLKELIEYQKKYSFLINVDGGINNLTINEVKQANIIVSGSFICYSKNYNETIDLLRNQV